LILDSLQIVVFPRFSRGNRGLTPISVYFLRGLTPISFYFLSDLGMSQPISGSRQIPDPAAPAVNPRRESANPSGWNRYLSVLERNRIPVNQRRWYVLRAEAFIDAVRPTRMGEVSVGQITTFFPRYAREQGLNERQYRQAVDAVQLMLVDLA
jgi:hypothetical protein